MRSPRAPGRRLLHLYPRTWRDRYGAEMAALLELRGLDLRARIDLVRGALDAHLGAGDTTPGRIGIGAALVAGAAWTIVAVASIGGVAPPDWPGYLAETLPLAVVGALAILVAAVAAARSAWSGNRLPLESGLVAVVVGQVVWVAALCTALLGGPYGAITVVASSLAAIGTAWLGIALMRTGLHPVGEAVAVAGAVMLIPSPAAWLVSGTLWTGIGLWRVADGRSVGSGGAVGLSIGLVVALVVAACGATATPMPAPAGAPEVRIDVVARDIAFQPAAVAIPAGTDFVVHLDNRDAGVPHNVALLADANFSTTLAKGEIVTGPEVVDLAIAGLIPGRYRLMCEVHPNMLVDLTVEP